MIVSRLQWPLALCLITAVGCSAQGKAAVKKQTSHVHALAAQYLRANAKLGHAPKDEPEFKRALSELKIPLEALKVNAVDDLFISERDGQPLTVVYGTLPKGSDIVVYEKTGLGGRRFIGHINGLVEEVDEDGFNTLAVAKR